MTKLYIELHALQNHVLSNLNRGETGSPKTFSDATRATRAYFSSQSSNRAERLYVREHFGDASVVQTRMLPRMVADALRELRSDISEEVAVILGAAAVKSIGYKVTGDRSDAVMVVRARLGHEIAAILADDIDVWLAAAPKSVAKKKVDDKVKKEGADDEDEKVKSFLDADTKGRIRTAFEAIGPEIGMFGRMVACDSSLSRVSATLTAHAFSTHDVGAMVHDDFTACDDVVSEHRGGAHMGVKPLVGTACIYRYRAFDVRQLTDSLGLSGAELAPIVRNQAEAWVKSQPNGMKAKAMAQASPFYVLAVVRVAGAPRTLGGTFFDPVRGADIPGQSLGRLEHAFLSQWRVFDGADVAAAMSVSTVDTMPTPTRDAASIDSEDPGLDGSLVIPTAPPDGCTIRRVPSLMTILDEVQARVAAFVPGEAGQ